jgi:hypothetical protein
MARLVGWRVRFRRSASPFDEGELRTYWLVLDAEVHEARCEISLIFAAAVGSNAFDG